MRVYVCWYVQAYVCVSIFLIIAAPLSCRFQPRICVCVHVCMYVCMNVCECVLLSLIIAASLHLVDFSHKILCVYVGVCMWGCVCVCGWVYVCVCVKGSRDIPLFWYHQQLKTNLLTDSGKIHHQQADGQTDPPIEIHRRILESKIQCEFFFQMPKTPSFYP